MGVIWIAMVTKALSLEKKTKKQTNNKSTLLFLSHSHEHTETKLTAQCSGEAENPKESNRELGFLCWFPPPGNNEIDLVNLCTVFDKKPRRGRPKNW